MNDNVVARLRAGENIMFPGFLISNDTNGCTIIRYPDEYEIVDANGNVITRPGLEKHQPPAFYLKAYPDGSVDILMCPEGCLYVNEETPL